MIWNDHKQYEGTHAFLGASQPRWLDWDDDTTADRYFSHFSAPIGTAIHLLAHKCIVGRIKLNKGDKHLVDFCMYENYIPRIAYDADKILFNLVPFVNDAIGFHMQSEIVLFYSMDCYGTTDAISYDEKEHILRIHDLKTGDSPADPRQLKIYAAYFYLEYKLKPSANQTIIRIYQNGDIYEEICDPAEIEKRIAEPCGKPPWWVWLAGIAAIAVAMIACFKRFQ